ncbi:hypothetical protein LXL04_027249 [Taraxacum kok-saghyz]
MASLVLLLSELLKHHDSEFGYTSSSRPCFSGGAAMVASDSGGSCAAAKTVAGKSWATGFGGYHREEELVESEAEFRFNLYILAESASRVFADLLVIVNYSLLNHHDADHYGSTSSSSSSSSSSRPSCFSGGSAPAAAAGGGGSYAAAKRVNGRPLISGTGGHLREEDLKEDEPELRVCVEFV